MATRLAILLVAADARARATLARSLAPRGHHAQEASTTAEVGSALAGSAIDVVVADCAGVARDVAAFLHLVEELAPSVPVIILTDAVDRSAAAEALRQGASAVLERGADPEVLLSAVTRAAEHARLKADVARLSREVLGPRDRIALLGRSDAMRDMSRHVDALAPRTSAVLITGAQGTGKTTLARELHARSPRAARPFITVSCEGVSSHFLESQIFGHVRGAFVGAVADHEGAFRAAQGGTVFIDRIEFLPVPLQARLVAVLAENRVTPLGTEVAREVEARLVATTHRDLAELVRSGTFRDDLFQRVSAQHLKLPALAARPEDVLFLAEAFVAEIAGRHGVAPRRIEVLAQAALQACSWPGNVRQLHHAIEHAFAHASGEVIQLGDLPPAVRALARSGFRREADRLPTLAEAEAELVGLVLAECDGNKTRAAAALGIDRKRLYRKIRRYGLLGAGGAGSDADDDDDEADD